VNGEPSFREIFVPTLQTLVLLACIVSVTVLGVRSVIDAAAVTAIIGAIVGSVGVLAGIGMVKRANGNGNNAPTPPEGR
jgi:hypothetical protein